MPKPFKFRYVNEIVGGFVLLVVVLLVSGVLLVGHYQDWFTPVHTVHLAFPPEGSLDLRKGSEVKILGAVVGHVDRIRIGDDDSMSGDLLIKGDAFRFVRTDSKVIVKKQFAAFGEAYVEIVKGQGARLESGGTLAVVKDTEIFEIAQQMLNQIREATIPLLGQVRVTAEEYGALASDLRSVDGPLMKLMANLEQISAGIRKGDGSVGKLLQDPAVADEVQHILKQANDALAQVQRILEDVKKTSVQLPPMAARVGHETEDLPGLVLQTQETIRESERLIEGIQKHWLLRPYVPQPKPTDLIPPSELGSPAPAGRQP